MKADISRHSAGVLWLYALQIAPITIAPITIGLTGIARPAIASTNPPAPVGDTSPIPDGDRLALVSGIEPSARTVARPETMTTIEHSDAPSRQVIPLRQQALSAKVVHMDKAAEAREVAPEVTTTKKRNADSLISASIIADNPSLVAQNSPITQIPKPEPKQPEPIAPSTPVPSTPKLKTEIQGDPPAQAPLCPTSPDNPVEKLPETIQPSKFEFIKGVKNNPLNSSEWHPVEFSEKDKRWQRSKNINLEDWNEKLSGAQLELWKLGKRSDPPQKYIGQKLQPSELVTIASKIAQRYADEGYATTGAIVCISKDTQSGKSRTVTIRIIEGNLNEIRISLVRSEEDEKKGHTTGLSRPPLEAYIKSHLGVAVEQPTNVNKLKEALQLLQLDSGELFESVTARLSSDVQPGGSILDVTVVPKKKTFQAIATLDNNRVPSVGSLQRRLTLREANLLGLGDSLRVGYTNSNGSNGLDVNYAFPITPRNTTLSLSFNGNRSMVVEKPFDDLDGDGKIGDIKSASQSYEISLRHPLFRRIGAPRKKNGDIDPERPSVFREFAIGVTGSLRSSNTTLLKIPFPLSPGADDNGVTKAIAVRFFQEFTQQSAEEVLFLRSQFNVGLQGLGATINQPIPGLNEFVPDSRFFSWLGQAQWVRRIGGNPQKSPSLALRATAQFADRPLLSSEQISIGGYGTVRGYRQDILQADSGMYGTAELQIPVAAWGRERNNSVQLIPFIDYGTAWNSDRSPVRFPGLFSAGLGLQLRSERLTARLDWGVLFKAKNSKSEENNTWQDNGVHFSMQWSL
jgi:hemolysin activation/secretion protein